MILSAVNLRMLTIVHTLCVSIARCLREGIQKGYKLIWYHKKIVRKPRANHATPPNS